MSDQLNIAELQKLAEAAMQPSGNMVPPHEAILRSMSTMQAFRIAANPQSILSLVERIKELERVTYLTSHVLAEAKLALEAVETVANNSKGIAGWHMNGDIAEWDKLLPEVGVALHAFEQLKAALASSQGEQK